MSMKKWMIIPTLAGVVAFGSVSLLNQPAEKVEAAQEKLITLQQAKAIAEKQMGGKVTEIELDQRQSRPVYEVEVKAKDRAYELFVDAKSGKVTVYDEDPITNSHYQSLNKGKNKAVNIARKHTGGHVVDVDFDEDDGRHYYEIYLKDDAYQYEVKIDAKTYKIVEVEKERFQSKKAKIANKKRLTQSQAIAIAKKQVNGKVTDVELDDGVVYEIEMKKGKIEYNLEIHAYTGKVLKFERDHDDVYDFEDDVNDDDDFDDDHDDDDRYDD